MENIEEIEQIYSRKRNGVYCGKKWRTQNRGGRIKPKGREDAEKSRKDVIERMGNTEEKEHRYSSRELSIRHKV
jgi:hypothetical protein